MNMLKNRLRSVLSLAVALVMAVGLTGCDALDNALNVEAPGLVDAGDMSRPGVANLLVSGTIADFDCALGAYIVNSGLLGNELRDASVTAARFPLDQRIIEDTSPYGVNSCAGNPPGIYLPLATAIWTSNNALELLKGWTDAEVDNRSSLIAQAAAYSGYSHVLMGEGFCSAVITSEGPEVHAPGRLPGSGGQVHRGHRRRRRVGEHRHPEPGPHGPRPGSVEPGERQRGRRRCQGRPCLQPSVRERTPPPPRPPPDAGIASVQSSSAATLRWTHPTTT
jgi:hypothetical protein